MLTRKSVSAVIPTRGDVDYSAIEARLRSYPEIDDINFVIDNSVYNRYLAAGLAQHEIVYTQDDDCLTDIRSLLDNYRPGVIVNAMTRAHESNYRGRITLVGFGAIFDKKLIDCLDGWEKDSLFLRECDRVFTALNEHETVFPDIYIMPAATSVNRLYRQPDHIQRFQEIKRRIFQKTGIQE